MSTLPTLLWLRFRRDRLQILVWLLLFALLEVVGHAAVTETYGSESERASVIKLVIMTPAILMLRGTPQGTQVSGDGRLGGGVGDARHRGGSRCGSDRARAEARPRARWVNGGRGIRSAPDAPPEL